MNNNENEDGVKENNEKEAVEYKIEYVSQILQTRGIQWNSFKKRGISF